MRQALCRERYAIFMPFVLRFFKTFLISAGKVNTFAIIRRRYLIFLFENPAEMFRRRITDNLTDPADWNIGGFQQLFRRHSFFPVPGKRKISGPFIYIINFKMIMRMESVVYIRYMNINCDILFLIYKIIFPDAERNRFLPIDFSGISA